MTHFIDWCQRNSSKFPKMGRNILMVLGGNIGYQFSTFFATVILGRSFTKQSFADFILCLTAMEILRFLSQFGFKLSAIRYASREIAEARNMAPVLTAHLIIQLTVAVIICLLTFLGAGYISVILFKDSNLSLPLRIIAFNVISVSLFETMTAYYNIREDFRSLTIRNLIMGGIRSLLIVISLLVFPGSLPWIVFFWVLSPLIVCIFYWRVFVEVLSYRQNWRQWIGRLASFSVWVFIGSILIITCSRLDVFWLNWQGVKSAVADYGVAITLATVIKVYAGSASFVLLPQACKRILNSQDIINQLKVIAKVSCVGLGMVVGLALIGGPAIKIIYGFDYHSAYLPTIILAAGYLCFLIQDLISQIFIGVSRPWLRAALYACQLVIFIILANTLISNYLAIGTALSVLIMNLMGVAIALAISLWLITSSKKPLPASLIVG